MPVNEDRMGWGIGSGGIWVVGRPTYNGTCSRDVRISAILSLRQSADFDQ